MSLPYLPRLFCLALACFILIYFACALTIALLAPLAIRSARKRSPSRAARLCLMLRLLPMGLATAATLVFCVPSYLWFEPERFDEAVGFVCLSLAELCVLFCGALAKRAVQSLIRSIRFGRRCRQSARETRLACNHASALLIETSEPCLALTGIIRPRIVISRSVVSALSEEELAVVMSHENAHRSACDNLKRLCLFLAPGSKALERSWGNFAEYAADQRAVSGDMRRSLALASALVRVARLGGTAHLTQAACFLAEPSDLSVRINRLLAEPASEESLPGISWYRLAAALILIPILFTPASFRLVHELLERLME